ncbi:hypothetical protein FANTH_9011 [Fusarium anthophilum]|uniref:Uncharacterized protein n=1 Tax=Fusarium anthophilum TaxID=48485 RepID=A0A8H4Z9A7_9HYPO|nr:hypothetical protein FANTH_9011 [Fusarium anthophilum]
MSSITHKTMQHLRKLYQRRRGPYAIKAPQGFTASTTPVRKPVTCVNNKRVIEVLFVHSAIEPTLLSSLDVADKILQGFSLPYRLTEVSFNQKEAYQDGKVSFDEMAARLQYFIESPRPKRYRKTEPPYLMIFADAPGSDLMKRISIRSLSRIPTNINLVLLLQDSEESNESHTIYGCLRQQANTLIKTNNNLFDEMILKRINPELNRMVWTTSLQRDFIDNESLDNDLLRLLREPFEMVLSRLYESMKISFVPQFHRVGSISSTSYFSQAQRYEDVLKASMPSEASASKSKAEKRAVSNIPKETSGKARWEDLRDQAESRLESGDNKHALAIFQECLRMRIPYNTAIWEIKSGLAFARMMLGQYVQAEKDLRQLLDDLNEFDNQFLKPSITNTHGAILLNHALALFRTGNFKDMKYCLNEIILPDEYMLPSSKHCNLSASVCRLRALVIAHQGFPHDPIIRKELEAADKWCEKLDNLKSEASLEANTTHEWCEKWINIESYEGIRISNILNKARIHVLRGCYQQALSVLEPALSDAIVKIGETSLLTIEAALLSSFLQVETGQVRLGRISCERCAEVIEEAFGNEHPLALEAEFILISAAQREGYLTLALDDSASLCKRAESTTDLGAHHPSTLKYKSQLGALHIECGNYSTAKAILTDVEEIGVRLWGDEHPDVLRVRSQLSLANYHLGALQTAETESFAVLYCQLRKYLRCQRDKLWQKYDSNDGVRSFLRKTPLLQGIEDAFAASRSEVAAHPDILYTLFTCGKILTRQPLSDLNLAHKILGLVRDAGKKSLGRFHPLPLLACLFIGEIHSTMGMANADDKERRELYRKAILSFTNVIGGEAPSSGCTNTVGEDYPDQPYLSVPLDSEHPIILHARQEYAFAKLLASEFENDTTQKVDYSGELNVILAAQQSRPGRSHRQTIKTLMTILTLELCLESPSVETVNGTISEIIWIIEKTDAEHQRFLECLLLRESRQLLSLEQQDQYNTAAQNITTTLRSITIDMSTSNNLASQWVNPSDVSTILFVLGGDVVQKAYSQATGKIYVPVCFSFGCVAYAFVALVGIIGDGRLLAPPDYPCKVLNLKSGYLRENKNFIIGRLLRDLEAIETREANIAAEDQGFDGSSYALKITVFEAMWNKNERTEFSWGWIHIVGIVITLIQLTLAFIPFIVSRTWSVLLITVAGILLVQWTGLLPQWRAEKLPNRQRSDQVYAITSGNGSREVMVIRGSGNCLDLESLAASQSPRNGRPWEKFLWLSRPQEGRDRDLSVIRRNTMLRKAKRSDTWLFRGVPIGFIITQASCACLSVLWLLLLVNVSARGEFPDSWCLLGVGGLGMFQNAWLAAKELTPESRNIPLKRVDQVTGRKAMDCIMDFHSTYNLGEPLRDEFFPGALRPDEEAWWKGDVEKYNERRVSEKSRGEPRRKPRYSGHESFLLGDDNLRTDATIFPPSISEKRPDPTLAQQHTPYWATSTNNESGPSTSPRPLPRTPTLEMRVDSKVPPVWAA